MSRTSSKAWNAGWLGLFALVGLTATGGCGGSDEEPASGTGGASASGGSTGAAASGGTGGSTATGGSNGADGGSAGSAGSTSELLPAICNHKQPTGDLIVDFSDYDSAGKWSSPSGINGGTFTYQGKEESTISYEVDEQEMLHVTATIAPGDYAGFGFWFGPCVDASYYSGVKFYARSNSGADLTAEFQIQTNRDYPIDPDNDKGACPWTDEETKWDECTFPKTEVTFPATGETVEVTWGQATGGNPVREVESNELLGLQWQFNCGSGEEACEVNITLDDVLFHS